MWTFCSSSQNEWNSGTGERDVGDANWLVLWYEVDSSSVMISQLWMRQEGGGSHQEYGAKLPGLSTRREPARAL